MRLRSKGSLRIIVVMTTHGRMVSIQPNSALSRPHRSLCSHWSSLRIVQAPHAMCTCLGCPGQPHGDRQAERPPMPELGFFSHTASTPAQCPSTGVQCGFRSQPQIVSNRASRLVRSFVNGNDALEPCSFPIDACVGGEVALSRRPEYVCCAIA